MWGILFFHSGLRHVATTTLVCLLDTSREVKGGSGKEELEDSSKNGKELFVYKYFWRVGV